MSTLSIDMDVRDGCLVVTLLDDSGQGAVVLSEASMELERIKAELLDSATETKPRLVRGGYTAQPGNGIRPPAPKTGSGVRLAGKELDV